MEAWKSHPPTTPLSPWELQRNSEKPFSTARTASPSMWRVRMAPQVQLGCSSRSTYTDTTESEREACLYTLT